MDLQTTLKKQSQKLVVQSMMMMMMMMYDYDDDDAGDCGDRPQRGRVADGGAGAGEILQALRMERVLRADGCTENR